MREFALASAIIIMLLINLAVFHGSIEYTAGGIVSTVTFAVASRFWKV